MYYKSDVVVKVISPGLGVIYGIRILHKLRLLETYFSCNVRAVSLT